MISDTQTLGEVVKVNGSDRLYYGFMLFQG